MRRKHSSCALFRAANLEILDYPFDAALASALAICDQAVVVTGQSQDNTLQWIDSLAKQYRGRVRTIHTTFTFDLGWQERWWNLAASMTDAEWLLWLDADEVIDPEHAPAIREQMEDPDVALIRFPFVHFYTTNRYQIDFALTHNTRLGRRPAGFQMRNWRTKIAGAAACQMVADQDGREVNAHTYDSPALWDCPYPILHYGWCRNPMALAQSQRKQAAWYKDGDGLADGRMPLVQPYDYRLDYVLTRGRASEWNGTHPAAMEQWFARHEWHWRQLEQATERQAA